MSDAKIDALEAYTTSDLYDGAERVALAFADAMTYSDQDVSAEIFQQLQQHYNDDEIVELTAIIAWENASSKFNRALRVPSMGLWEREDAPE